MNLPILDTPSRLPEITEVALTVDIVSITAVTSNPVAMMIWALLIVILIGIGFATVYVALIFTGSLVEHATWQAYRELVPIKQV
jgi:uncharacterized membrane protein